MKIKKVIKSIFLTLMAVSLLSAPCFGTPITKGDQIFGGKVTFLKDVIAKQDFTVEGAIAGETYSQTFYVSSATGSDVPHYGTNWQKPYASIAYALDQCTANRGAVIYVLPGHTKTIAADSGVDIDVAGVSVICLGQGSDRPTFTFTATAGDFKMAAANTKLYNALFVTNVDGHDMAIEVSADDVEIGWCEFREGTHQPEFGIQVGAGSADNDADRCWIHDCKFYVPTAGDGDAAISVIKDMTGVKIERNVIYGDFDEAGIDVPSTGNTQVDMLISDCVITQLLSANHAIQVNGAGSTGKIVNCYIESDAIGTSIDAGGLEPFNVLWSDGTDQASAAQALSPVGGASTFSTDELAAIEGECEDAIEADSLDHLCALTDGAAQKYPLTAVEDSIICKILGDDDPAVCTSYDNSKHSLEAIGDLVADTNQQSNITTAIAADSLDHLLELDGATQKYPENCATDSILAKILCDDDPAVPSTYDNSTDSLEALGNQVADTNLEARVVAANVTDLLDHLAKTGDGTAAYPASVANDTILALLMSDDDPAAVSSYNNTTDSLEAISVALGLGTGCTTAIDNDGLDHLVTTADGTGVFPASVAEDSILAKILGDDTTAVATTYDNTTDSLEAIGNKTTDQAYWQERTIKATTDFTASSDTMFTVAGGAIKITSLFGKCTTLAAGSPGTMTIQLDATAGVDYDADLSTTVNVDALGAGDSIRFSNAIDEGVLSLTANTGAGMPLSWFVDAGNINQTLSSTGTGAVTWYMTYVPLETGVTVTAP